MEKATTLNIPLVSVCIPAYNCAKYLREALTSIIEQTYPNIEVIVVDDGSEDDTLQIAKEFEADNVTSGKLDHRGASAARNTALRNSKGDYIQFMDADDLLHKDKIALQVAALAGSMNSVAVCSTVHFFDGDDPFAATPSAYEEQFLYTTDDPVLFLTQLWGGQNFQASMIQPNAWLTPRSLITFAGEWDETLTLDDDGEFFARIILNADGVIRTGGLNYYRKYRIKDNLSSQKNRMALRSYYNSTLLKTKYLTQKREDEFTQRAVFKQLTDLAVRCYDQEPDLYNEVNKALNNYQAYPYKVILGGTIINTISNLAGWRFAKKLQSFFR